MDLLTAVVSFISGLMGSMGFGGGTVLIMYLTLFQSMEQKQAQGINLMFFIPYALYSVICYFKNGLIDKKTVLPLIVYGLAGVAIGYYILTKIDTDVLTKVFGIFLILLGIKELFSKKTQ